MNHLVRRAMWVTALSLGLGGWGCDADGDGDGGSSRSANILALDGDTARGEAVFTGNLCSDGGCHGSTGDNGMSNLSSLVPAASDSRIVDSLLDGRGAMPSQAGLSDQQLADVLAWLNENFTS